MPLRPTNVGDDVIYRNTHGRSSKVKVTSVQGYSMTTIGSNISATGFTTGGTLTAATYSYKVTYVRGSHESVVSTAVTGTVSSGTTGRVDLSWNAVSGASSYKIYGRTGGTELLMATQAGTTYSDTGATTPSGAQPATDGRANFANPHAKATTLSNILPGSGANQYENRW